MFDQRPDQRPDPGEPAHPGEERFDYAVLVDGLRAHTTDWLERRREWLVREQRRLRVEELAVTRVLDDRGAIDDTVAQHDGVSVRSLRETVATARALEELPTIAEVAHAGRLSSDQLEAVVKLAEPGDEVEWARRAASWSPADLAQQARLKAKPTAADGAARRAARDLGFWWERESGMLAGRFRLPDVDGALFESVVNQMIERMRPAKGQQWETRARRGADALVELCRGYADVNAASTPTPHFIVEVPMRGPATVAGIPLPDAMIESLRAQAKVEPVLVDDMGAPVEIGRVEPVVPRRITNAVLRRDAQCRVPGCAARRGLRVQQLLPGTWAGSDDLANLAAVCTTGSDHADTLAPNGPYLLLGNPNRPDGLHLVHRDDLPRLVEAGPGAPACASPDARAGPDLRLI